LFKWPKTRQEFWQEKIGKNESRDKKHEVALVEAGWRVGRVWECALKGKSRKPLDLVAGQIGLWLTSEEKKLDIRGYE